MQVGGFTLLQAMADKMRWHQARQTMLAENVANADTPGYVGRDLMPFSFEPSEESSSGAMTVSETSPSHIAISSGGQDGFAGAEAKSFETSPDGNTIVLEDEMMKVSSNEADYQTVAALYSRSLRLLRTALGKTA